MTSARSANGLRPTTCGRTDVECFIATTAHPKAVKSTSSAAMAELLVFAEVKTRTSDRFGRPMDAVDADKERLIIKGGMHWLRLLDDPDIFFRFDVVEVLLRETQPPQVTWVKEAFGAPKHYRF